ncbi:cell wall protein precursor [Trema orientale]|uniref:Cell wall protein n=1 Tax=Trema orientale TaxID=63057 RepID=A0A2P5EGG2_TREOI|nr:cell wall protein precursor [Trema orientale]
MAYKTQYSSLLSLLFVLGLLLAIANKGVAGRSVPVNSKNVDKKHPEWLVDHDGTVLIPGFGRIIPPPLHGHNFYKNYNPITGTYGPSGSGHGGLGHGSIGSGIRRRYVPGNDDTFIPNPGFEVPIPGSGGGVPIAANP